MRQPILVMAGLAVILLMPGAASARQTRGPYTDTRALPETPAGQRVQELLEAINSGDRRVVESFITRRFIPQFRDDVPMDEHLSIFEEVYASSHGYDFYAIRSYDPPGPRDEIVAIVRNRLMESWEGLMMTIEPEAPYRIAGLRFAAARPPSDLPPAGRLDDAELVARLDAFVQRLAEADAFSGAVLLARDGQVLYRGAVGLANRSAAHRNDVDTLFNLGSMNKMMTAVAIAQLVEQGRMSYDDTIDRHLGPGWLPASITTRVRVGHLLNHTSGLGSYFNETFFESSRELFRDVDDYKPLVEGETLAFEPGTGERYSNTGFMLLGAIIENVSGETYFEYIRRHVYGPAGMTRSDSYEMDRMPENLAIGYSRERGPDGEIVYVNNLFKHVIKGGPAGGGFSTVDDLHRFDRALRSGTLVTPETTELLWSPKPSSPEYGYGFGLGGTAENRVVGHGGGFPGIGAQLDMYIDTGFTVVVLSNYDRAARLVSGKLREWLR